MILYLSSEVRLSDSGRNKIVNETGRIVIERYYGNANFKDDDVLDILCGELIELQGYINEYGSNSVILVSNLFEYCFNTMEQGDSHMIEYFKSMINFMEEKNEPIAYMGLGHSNNIPKDLKHIQYYRMDTNGIEQVIETCVNNSFYKDDTDNDDNLYLSDTP